MQLNTCFAKAQSVISSKCSPVCDQMVLNPVVPTAALGCYSEMGELCQKVCPGSAVQWLEPWRLKARLSGVGRGDGRPLAGGLSKPWASWAHQVPHARLLARGVWYCRYSVTKSCQILATPWTVAHQAPQSMKFPRQEYWSGLPLPSAGDLPQPRDRTCVSWISKQSLYHWASWGARGVL